MGGTANFTLEVPEEPFLFQPVPAGVRRVSDASDEALPWLPVCPMEQPTGPLDSLYSDPTLQCASTVVRSSGSLVERLLVERTEVEVTVLVLKAGLDWLPLALSVWVLWTTLLLKLFWWRSESTVHLITAVALHGMLLWALVLSLLFAYTWVAVLMSLWYGFQVLFGLKRAYGSGWPRTVLSMTLLSVPWLLGAVGCMLLAFLLGLYQLNGLV